MTFDVAIVGAGPSGAWAGYRLAKHGARVALFDASHPREKPCGGGVTGRALTLVDDALKSTPLAATTITRARFIDVVTGRSASVALEAADASAAPLVVSSRTDFDGALLDAARRAGAQHINARVTNLSDRSDHVELETSHGRFAASWVIGADGVNSLVRRRLAAPFPRSTLSIATGFFAHGPTSDEIVIALVADPPGYLWSFPRPDHLAIGICSQADAGVTADALRRLASQWVARAAIAPNARLQPYSWPIPSLDEPSLRQLTLFNRRWCLVGDAAGLVDPLTREGIYFGLCSGEWAAEAISAGNLLPYRTRVYDELIPELARAARLKAGFFQPAFTQLLIGALAEHPPVASVMADLVAGRQPYAGLKWRLLKTREWRLAFELLLTVWHNRRAPAREARAASP